MGIDGEAEELRPQRITDSGNRVDSVPVRRTEAVVQIDAADIDTRAVGVAVPCDAQEMKIWTGSSPCTRSGR